MFFNVFLKKRDVVRITIKLNRIEIVMETGEKLKIKERNKQIEA